MRAYTVAAVAVTLKMPPKWVDNVLSHHAVRGVSQKRQGVARRLTPQAVTTLEVALRLCRVLSVPLSRALVLAHELVEKGDSSSRLELSHSVAIVVDVVAIASDTAIRLAHAVEVAPTPKRGRPRR
jgi:hypothetical protein